MPNSSHVGISQRIEDIDERKRLRDIVLPYCGEEHGFIVRTPQKVLVIKNYVMTQSF